jgi:hypothetical protein
MPAFRLLFGYSSVMVKTIVAPKTGSEYKEQAWTPRYRTVFKGLYLQGARPDRTRGHRLAEYCGKRSGSLGVSTVVQFSLSLYLRMDEGGNCELVAYHCCCQDYGRYVLGNWHKVVE